MIIDVKPIRDNKKIELKKRIAKLGLVKFVIIQVGNRADSTTYIKNKIKLAQELGIIANLISFDNDVLESIVIDKIKELNNNDDVHGMIVQLPLPSELNSNLILSNINPKKDIDGLHPESIGNLYYDRPGFVPCTTRGIKDIFDYYNINLEGKNVVVAGCSNLVGKNVAMIMMNAGATVTSCNSKTKNIKKYIDEADIFISAIGEGKFFNDKYFTQSKELVIIDVGINFIDSKIVGDIDFKRVCDKVKLITPVPGGVGLLTTINLMENVTLAKERI